MDLFFIGDYVRFILESNNDYREALRILTPIINTTNPNSNSELKLISFI